MFNDITLNMYFCMEIARKSTQIMNLAALLLVLSVQTVPYSRCNELPLNITPYNGIFSSADLLYFSIAFDLTIKNYVCRIDIIVQKDRGGPWKRKSGL